MNLKLYLRNTLSAKVELFEPIDLTEIRMYVCGPTVYDRAHLGNARSVIVYDILFRILRKMFTKVTYIRNITDVDDKIINRALEQKVSSKEISELYTKYFHEDMMYLKCLSPTEEPRATEYIQDMIELIQKLISNGSAYESNGCVYFSVSSFPDYGVLSRRDLEDQRIGERIEVNTDKRNPLDFVLWKVEKTGTDAIYDSPWGFGRPGWHIECSAMSIAKLGVNFDIHGGGGDLRFPHHENEIAQACAAYKGSHYAKYWIHNGFLMVNNDKMSKSLGNFVTVADLIEKGVDGNIIRYALLTSNYDQQLNWSDNLVTQARNNLSKITKIYEKFAGREINTDEVHSECLEALLNNMSSWQALMSLQTLANNVRDDLTMFSKLKNSFDFMGFEIEKLLTQEIKADVDEEKISEMIELRNKAKKNKDFKKADEIREKLRNELGIVLKDNKDGSVIWEHE